jgi:hypothetical protein
MIMRVAVIDQRSISADGTDYGHSVRCERFDAVHLEQVCIELGEATEPTSLKTQLDDHHSCESQFDVYRADQRKITAASGQEYRAQEMY